MPVIQHFQYGLVNPLVAYVMSVLGCLLGLAFATQSRSARGARRIRLLGYAAVSIGGTGIWLMHFIAMLGFDVPDSDIRYNVPLTATSGVLAVGIVAVGLMIAHLGRTGPTRLLIGGTFTGLGVAAMHYTGMAAVRLSGTVSYKPLHVVLSVGIAVVAATVALWFTAVVEGLRATWIAAAVMGVAVCGMHYTAMSAVDIHLHRHHGGIDGVNPMFLLPPMVVIGGTLIAILAFAVSGQMEATKMRVVPPTAPADDDAGEPEHPLDAIGLAGTAPSSPALPPRYPPEPHLTGHATWPGR
jgi:NO-binding membrane sensor protein with MHYT domain